MSYMIFQFTRPKIHRAGQVTKDLRRIGPIYANLEQAEQALCNLMDKNRRPNIFLRLDRNVRANPVAYADLSPDGGVVRFKQRSGKYPVDIPLDEFKERLSKKGK